MIAITPRDDRTTATETEELRTEVSRLRADLAATRLTSANRLAAIRAALGAADDGEADPLSFLRDELPDYLGIAGYLRLTSGL